MRAGVAGGGLWCIGYVVAGFRYGYATTSARPPCRVRPCNRQARTEGSAASAAGMEGLTGVLWALFSHSPQCYLTLLLHSQCLLRVGAERHDARRSALLKEDG